MAEEKQPYEKLADKEPDVKTAEEVHYQDVLKKADKAGEAQQQDQEKRQII